MPCFTIICAEDEVVTLIAVGSVTVTVVSKIVILPWLPLGSVTLCDVESND